MVRPAALLLASILLAAAPPASISGEDIFSRLERIGASVRTVRSGFIQEKRLALFRETLVSRGRFSFAKPDRLRWETLEPVKTGFSLRGEEGRRWNERTGLSEPFNLDRDPLMRVVSAQILAWATADFPALRRDYRITVLRPDPATLELTPLSPEGASFLDRLLIVFAAGGQYVQEVEVHEKGGDFTRIRFTNAEVNVPLPADAF